MPATNVELLFRGIELANDRLANLGERIAAMEQAQNDLKRRIDELENREETSTRTTGDRLFQFFLVGIALCGPVLSYFLPQIFSP